MSSRYGLSYLFWLYKSEFHTTKLDIFTERLLSSSYLFARVVLCCFILFYVNYLLCYWKFSGMCESALTYLEELVKSEKYSKV